MWNDGVSRSAQWIELYRSALIETDQTKLLSSIGDAHGAIMDRIEEILTKPSSPEHQQLNDALRKLGELRHSAQSWPNKDDHLQGRKAG